MVALIAGDKAPDLEGINKDSQKIGLSDFYGKKRELSGIFSGRSKLKIIRIRF